MSLDDYRADGGYAALARALEIGPEARHRRGHRLEADGSRRRGLPDRPQVGRRRHPARAAALPRVQRRRVRAGHVQGPGPARGRPVRHGRGDDHRRLRDRREPRATSTSAASTPTPRRASANAIERAREAGLLGPDILGSGFAFDIELRRGAGAYICGEETALFESIEGKRGEPRNKPPFPVEVGLFGKPTVVNNVETLANVPLIVLERRRGVRPDRHRGLDRAEALLPVGPRRPAGRLRGRVRRDAAATSSSWPVACPAAAPSGRSCSAARPGVFVGPEALDMPLTFEATRAAGATLGSGVIMVFDETVDLVDTLRRIAQFFRDESCGQCVPCRVGTVRQEELLARLAAGSRVRSRDEELGAAARDRPGDARRVDLRARPDGVVGDRVRAPAAGYGGPVSDGLSMDRDPAPDALTPHAGEAPGAQPLTDILLTPAGARVAATAPRRSEAPPDQVALTDRRRGRDRPGGLDDPRRLPRPRASTRRPCATPRT